MCGYLNDAPRNSPTEMQLRTQFEVGYHRFQEVAQKRDLPTDSVVFKVFTSGSFLDPEEVPTTTQDKIFEQLAQDRYVAEVAVESRPEFVLNWDPSGVQNLTQRKHLDVGVGLEAVTDHYRDTYIQKGFSFADFLTCNKRLQDFGVGMKAYLTLKPPFVTESVTIAETIKSIQVLGDLGVDTISVNPVAVQKNTLTDHLFKKHLFRPPWLFSVLLALEQGTYGLDLTQTRVLCDPIAAGKIRGTHNCKDPQCNQACIAVLHDAVKRQDFTNLLDQVNCNCKVLWHAEMALL